MHRIPALSIAAKNAKDLTGSYMAVTPRLHPPPPSTAAKNEKELREMPPKVVAEMNFTFVKDVEEVLQVALIPADDDDSAAAPDPDPTDTGAKHPRATRFPGIGQPAPQATQ